ncbi:hypothetical protein [Nocardia sp. NPDC052566]|uniref:hypothetical protein n=1 Tax=Nocardia sp. NPDC052566 TaxID=3364330 RepID=UPI0037C89198
MNAEMLGAVALAVLPALLIYGLFFLRWRRIKRYGKYGGEFNHPFSSAGYGGVPPGTEFQHDFGGPGTSQQR